LLKRISFETIKILIYGNKSHINPFKEYLLFNILLI
jgi:hypothetical protein